jgi:DNA-binding IclR family transcriptional regulator
MVDSTHNGRKANVGAQTLARGLDVLSLIVDAQGPQRPAEIARALGLERSAVYRLLRELESSSFVTREGDSGRYAIGSGLVALSARVVRRIDLRGMARPIMEQLGQATGETISLHVRQGRSRICVETVAGRHTVSRVVEIGETLPLEVGPSGKVILAFIEPAEMASIVEAAAQDDEERATTYAVLEQIRSDGYFAIVGDRSPAVGGLSAPFFNADGIVGALTISGPSSRWNHEAQIAAAPQIVAASVDLSTALGHRPD